MRDVQGERFRTARAASCSHGSWRWPGVARRLSPLAPSLAPMLSRLLRFRTSEKIRLPCCRRSRRHPRTTRSPRMTLAALSPPPGLRSARADRPARPGHREHRRRSRGHVCPGDPALAVAEIQYLAATLDHTPVHSPEPRPPWLQLQRAADVRDRRACMASAVRTAPAPFSAAASGIAAVPCRGPMARDDQSAAPMPALVQNASMRRWQPSGCAAG